MKICWTCDDCNWLVISDSKEHHQMDSCACGNCSMDLEEYHNRYSCKDISKLRIIAKFKDGDKWRYVRR